MPTPNTKPSAPTAAIVVLAALACGAGCRRAPENGRIQATYDPETGRLSELTYDANGDGRPDSWTHMDGTRLLRAEVDTDADGVIDRWEYYTPDRKLEKVGISRANDGIVDAWVFEAPGGTVERIEVSTNRDGVVDRTEYYEGGRLVRADQDTNGDGATDKWETFSNGALTSVAFDTEGLGQPTRRLLYAPDGSLERIESGSPLDNPSFEGRLPDGVPDAATVRR